jgi:hypothetical protein
MVRDEFTGKHTPEYEGPYIDRTTVYGSDTTRTAKLMFAKLMFAKMRFPNSTPTGTEPETEPEQFFSYSFGHAFVVRTADPMLNLGVQIMRQCLSVLPVKGDARMGATEVSNPPVTTPFAQILTDMSKDQTPIVIPRQEQLNTEDVYRVELVSRVPHVFLSLLILEYINL